MYRSIFGRKEDSGPSIKRIIQVLKDNGEIGDLEQRLSGLIESRDYHYRNEINHYTFYGKKPTKFSETHGYEKKITPWVSEATTAIKSCLEDIESVKVDSKVEKDVMGVISDKR
jgi:hypothetical protein